MALSRLVSLDSPLPNTFLPHSCRVRTPLQSQVFVGTFEPPMYAAGFAEGFLVSVLFLLRRGKW